MSIEMRNAFAFFEQKLEHTVRKMEEREGILLSRVRVRVEGEKLEIMTTRAHKRIVEDDVAERVLRTFRKWIAYNLQHAWCSFRCDRYEFEARWHGLEFTMRSALWANGHVPPEFKFHAGKLAGFGARERKDWVELDETPWADVVVAYDAARESAPAVPEIWIPPEEER